MTNDQGGRRRVGAVVLVAGVSARMGGRFKPVLDVGGVAMVRRVVEGLVGVCRPVVVVGGYRAEAVRGALEGLEGEGVVVVVNEGYEAGGMVSSAQVGVRAMGTDVDGFVLSLGDQPAVRGETVSQLVGVWRTGAAEMVVPVYDGKRGHPVVMSKVCAGDVLKLGPGQTLKTVVERYKDWAVEVPVDDPGVVMDVDTPEDYERLRKYWDERYPS